jgi:hypothetical protein
MSEANRTVETSCGYCGHANPRALNVCEECGSSLTGAPPAEDSRPKKKSKVLAVILAFALGPLRLFYASISGGGIMILIALPLYFLTHGGWWFTIGSRIICAAWAFAALYEQDETPNAKRDSKRLLNEAASLESVDRAKAIAVYEQVVRSFPCTPARREAERNIRTLNKQS